MTIRGTVSDCLGGNVWKGAGPAFDSTLVALIEQPFSPGTWSSSDTNAITESY